MSLRSRRASLPFGPTAPATPHNVPIVMDNNKLRNINVLIFRFLLKFYSVLGLRNSHKLRVRLRRGRRRDNTNSTMVCRNPRYLSRRTPLPTRLDAGRLPVDEIFDGRL